jgi:hypothetical protein
MSLTRIVDLSAVPLSFRVRHWYLSINYLPVEFHNRNVCMLLPQTVDALYDFEDPAQSSITRSRVSRSPLSKPVK